MINLNRNISIFLSVFSLSFLIYSCSKEDDFTGSPLDSNVEFVNLQASISTLETEVMANQVFPVTISLGSITFPMDVSVEAIAFLPNLNKRARKSFIIPAGTSLLTSEMTAPSGDALGTDMPFDFELKLYITSITTAPDVTPKGFSGKQYKIVSDTVFLPYGDTTIPGLNTKRLAIRFDFDGPYNGTTGGFNNLDIVFKKNNVDFPLATQNTRPLNGTTKSPDRYESVNFLDDAKLTYKLYNETVNDSTQKIYTIKFNTTTTPLATVFNHGFKVGDEVKVSNFSGDNNFPIVQVTQVIDNNTFKCQAQTNLLGNSLSFYQPIIVAKGAWSPFVSYFGNDSAVYNGITYYCLKDITANTLGNFYPNIDIVNWTIVKPKLVWNDPISSAPTWIAGIADDTTTTDVDESTTYKVNDVFSFNNLVYVCIKQYKSTGTVSTPKPTNTTYWKVMLDKNKYTSDFSEYNCSDSYTINVFAKDLRSSPTDLKYRISLRDPAGVYKLFKGTIPNLSVGNAASSIPKIRIEKTTVQGVSTYVVTHL